jgi:hypothetical protein
MLNPIKKYPPSSDKSPLAQWIYKTIDGDRRHVQFRLRGNDLLLLCEGDPVPAQMDLLQRLMPALHQTEINTLLPKDQPPIYQCLLYGRQVGQERPVWTFRINLSQIERHLEQLRLQVSRLEAIAPIELQQTIAATPAVSTIPPANPPLPEQPGGSLILSNRSQARRGDPGAIARHLSETLSRLGVAVQVSAKTIPYQVPSHTPHLLHTPFMSASATQRLWTVCESLYSPDPRLIGEPIAQRLRDLELEGFRDAIISIQVKGEPEPDWLLRVDLTPAKEMLRELARWGDMEAITRLVQQAIADQGILLSANALKESTLHLSFTAAVDPLTSQSSASAPSATAIAPDQQVVYQAIAPLLTALGPQGIRAAALYGHVAGQEAPAWVDWLDLPAAEHTALAEPPLVLAKKGDWDAIAFLLNRLLNPNLDKRLATGGTRVQLLRKGDLLHIMTDAPICPDQRQVTNVVARLLKHLNLSEFAGVRIYGRRAGQKHPFWGKGIDFVARQRIVPEPAPEFAATDVYVGDLVAQPGDPILRSDLTQEDLHNAWKRLKDAIVQRLQGILTQSQLFIPVAEAADLGTVQPIQFSRSGTVVAAIWGAVGLLLTVQGDRLLSYVVQSTPSTPLVETLVPPAVSSAQAPSAENPTLEPPAPTFSNRPLTPPEKDEVAVFNQDGFTQTDTSTGSLSSISGSTSLSFPTGSLPPVSMPAPTGLAQLSPYPSFNSQQLDEKIALYHQQWEISGPPDVLIIGSSRALRGIDPAALRRNLADLGYANVSVFNYGINGATAQVVDLVIRRILTPAQLPRLILWADGARAFNSGNVDVTYNGIVVSEGYRDLVAGTLPLPTPAASSTSSVEPLPNSMGGLGASVAARYQTLDRWLSDRLGTVSMVHGARDRLKALLQAKLTTALPDLASQPTWNGADATSEGANSAQSSLADTQGAIDINGFLPLSIRFNPATYYQKYARVQGQYDNDYEDFRLEGKQTEALTSLLEFTQSQGVPLVFVNLPMTDDYLDPTRLQYEQAFRQYMVNLTVGRPDFIFRDLGELWPDQYAYFSDPSHLNQYGASEVANRLAQDPLIPWAKSATGESANPAN